MTGSRKPTVENLSDKEEDLLEHAFFIVVDALWSLWRPLGGYWWGKVWIGKWWGFCGFNPDHSELSSTPLTKWITSCQVGLPKHALKEIEEDVRNALDSIMMPRSHIQWWGGSRRRSGILLRYADQLATIYTDVEILVVSWPAATVLRFWLSDNDFKTDHEI